jgi:hypothetical protein
MSQLPLFGFKDMRMKAKVPISAERIREVQRQLMAGNSDGALEQLIRVREGLEDYEKRLKNK